MSDERWIWGVGLATVEGIRKLAAALDDVEATLKV